MSNRRRIRKSHRASTSARPAEAERRLQAVPRFPNKDPAVSTVRGWLRQLEAAGTAERKGVERTGKPGRPPTLWGLTEAGATEEAATPPKPPSREEARQLLHEACREEFGISGRQFVRRLDAGFYECGWKCRCTTPHQPVLRWLLRYAQWSRTSVVNASLDGPPKPIHTAVKRLTAGQ
jgi:hypothetical protein